MKSRVRLVLLGLAFVLGAGSARADLVTFNGHTNTAFGDGDPDNGLVVGASDGFGFTHALDHFRFINSASAGMSANNGTSFLLKVLTGDIDMFRVGGGTFDLLSVDLAESTNLLINVRVTGYFAAGGSLQTTLNLDDNANTWETFSLSGFVGLQHVTFGAASGGSTFAIDNLQIATAVPAPSGLFLAGLAAAVALSYRRLRRRPIVAQA